MQRRVNLVCSLDFLPYVSYTADMTATLGSTVKILIVDDENLIESLIHQKFREEIKTGHFEFLFASNGIDALEILKENSAIGIILIDLNMPIMNGFTLIDNLVHLNRIYRVIVVTAYGDMINIRRAMNGGASDFITKPIDLDDLGHTIERNIERYQNLKATAAAHTELLELSKELHIAKEIQRSLIPTQFNEFRDGSPLEIYGEVIPVHEMGGDFFDFFKLNDGHVGFFIGEVAARGIPAAIFMTITRTLLHTLALKQTSPSVCFDKINKLLLVKEIAFAIFVTAMYGIIDLKTGKVTYCNAGHVPLLVKSKINEIKEIGRYEGIPLAITEDPKIFKLEFKEKEFKLEKGDTILLYTKGVIDTQNAAREMFGEERLKEFLQNFKDANPETLVKALKENLNQFSQDLPQMNDVTLFSLRYKG